jgi:transposase
VLGVSAESICTWRRQDRSYRGESPSLSSTEKGEPTASKKRIAELETELAVHGRASALPEQVVPHKGSARRAR